MCLCLCICHSCTFAVCEWFCAWAWIYVFGCVCVHACGCVCWCLFCALLLMHKHSRDVCANGSWSCHGCIDCSDRQIIAQKSDQQPTHWGKNFSNQQDSGRTTLRSNMFNCLWCSPAPTAQGPGGEMQVQGLTFRFHSQPHSHIDRGNVSVLLTATLLQLQGTIKIEALYPLETVR